jgi:NAD(P)-dependent dehydrogenase (short-subunit alcohol dehydrogenase family)
MKSQAGKVFIVTGANTGIGKETARGIAAEGGTVVMAVRDVGKGEAARADVVATTGNPDVSVMALDLASTRSIRDFAKAFSAKYDRLDVLVNNAGVWTRTKQKTLEGFEIVFGVNHLGTFLLTHELLPLLERTAPSRVVVVSSALHYRGRMVWDDLMFERRPFGGTTAYNQSKLANVLFAKALARRLEGTGVTVNALHPGVVATELTRELPGFVKAIAGWFMLTPAQGARTSLHLALSSEVEKASGAYFEKSRERKASAAALDVTAQERLWKISEELLGLSGSSRASAKGVNGAPHTAAYRP